MSSRRRGASSTRSWPLFTKNWGWTPSPTTDNLHKDLAQDIPVQEQPCEGNADRREHRLTTEQPWGHAPTPPA
jgi:hypothetical protein